MTCKRASVLAALVFVLCLVFAFCTAALAESGTCGTCTWEIDDNGLLTISPTDGHSGTLGTTFFWCDYGSKIISVKVNPGVKAGSSCGYFLNGCSNLKSADLSNLDTSDAESLRSMFADCSSLESVNVSNFDTSKVKDMSYMFAGIYCNSLTSVDLSSFDTSSVTNTSNMFENCSNLKTITVDPDKWTMDKVGTSWLMFWGCTSLVGGAGTKFDSKQVKADYAHVDGGKANPGYLTSNKPDPGPVPSTGDNTPIMLTAGLLLLSGAALIALRKRAAK